MSNNYFQFKQFLIQQDACAMKVTTDACLFGAWAAEKMQNETDKINKVLDIGTGTGLLSLLLAQKNSTSIIDAVEIDESAAIQAQQNFKATTWEKRLQVFTTSIQRFSHSSLYDFIITNPPFFNNDLLSENDKRNLALHSKALTLEELIQAIKINLSLNGKFAILLPYHRTESFIQLAAEHFFYVEEKVMVKQTDKHDYFRSMLLFGKEIVSIKLQEIIIKKNDTYSNEFKNLLSDYYLHL